MSNVSTVVKAVEKALSLWETFIKTRQQAYERKMDKSQRKAIDAGEEFILTYYSDEEDKEKKLDKIQKKFFKYN